MGLRGAEDHAPAIHVSSLLSSQLLVQSLVVPGQPLVPALVNTQEEGHLTGTLSPGLLAALGRAQGEEAREADLVGLTQKQLSLKVDLRVQQQVNDNQYKRVVDGVI